MLATHIYMHRCSVEIEIEIEKELEKGGKYKMERSPRVAAACAEAQVTPSAHSCTYRRYPTSTLACFTHAMA